MDFYLFRQPTCLFNTYVNNMEVSKLRTTGPLDSESTTRAPLITFSNNAKGVYMSWLKLISLGIARSDVLR